MFVRAAVPGRSGAPPPRLIAAMRPCGGLLNEAMGCRQGDDHYQVRVVARSRATVSVYMLVLQ